MPNHCSAATFIGDQRLLLDRLEAFVQTDAYRTLQAAAAGGGAGLPERWLMEWLITPAHRFVDLPIDQAQTPVGLAELRTHLARLVAGVAP